MEKKNYIKPEITIYDVELSRIIVSSTVPDPSPKTEAFSIDSEEELNNVSAW